MAFESNAKAAARRQMSRKMHNDHLFPRQIGGLSRRLHQLCVPAETRERISKHLVHIKYLMQSDPMTQDAETHAELHDHLNQGWRAYLEECAQPDSELWSRFKALSITAVNVQKADDTRKWLEHEEIVYGWEHGKFNCIKTEKRAIAMCHLYGSEVYRDELDDDQFSMELNKVSGRSYRNQEGYFLSVQSRRTVPSWTLTGKMTAEVPPYPEKRFLTAFTTCPREKSITRPTPRQRIQESLSGVHERLPKPEGIAKFEESTANTHIRNLLNAQINEVGNALAVVQRACHELTGCHPSSSSGRCRFDKAQEDLENFASTLRETALAQDIETNGERSHQLETLRVSVTDSCDDHHCEVYRDLWHKMQALSLTTASIKEGRDLQHCHSYQDILWSWEPVLDLAKAEFGCVSDFLDYYYDSGMWCIYTIDREDRPFERTDIEEYLDGATALAPFEYCDISNGDHYHPSRFATDDFIAYQSP